MFMPFQILGGLFRALLTIALVGGGIYLLIEWNNHRLVPVTVPIRNPNEMARPNEVGPPESAREIQETRLVPWHFGLNVPTALLLGGLALLTWATCGWCVPSLLFRRGGDEVKTGDRKRYAVGRLRSLDGSELHVEARGPEDAPVIVMTHGWSLNHSEWRYARKELARQYRVITWDLPGLGKSTGPADKNWSLERMAEDLHAVIGLAGDRPVVLVGHSIGGMIILTYCRLYPATLGKQILGLVIGQSTYINPVKTAAMAGLYTALQKPVLEPLCHLMIWLSPLFSLLNWLSYLNGSLHRSVERSSLSGGESRSQLNSLTLWSVQASPAVVARGFLGMFRYDATETLATIPIPALIVAGDRDNLCVPEASAYMAATIPGGQRLTLRNAQHCGLFEHHKDFNDAVSHFTSKCFQAGPTSDGHPKVDAGVVVG